METMNTRPCGPRVSSKHPTAYRRDELISLAISKGLSSSKAQKLRIKQLCEFLSLSYTEENEQKKTAVTIENPRVIEFDLNRLCGPYPTANNNAYTKKELEELAVRFLGMKKGDVIKTSKESICEALRALKRKELESLRMDNQNEKEDRKESRKEENRERESIAKKWTDF